MRDIDFRGAAFGRLPFGFRTKAPSCVNAATLTGTLSCMSTVNVRGVTTRRRRLALCTVRHLGRVGKVHVFKRTRRGDDIVSFLMKGVRRLSVNALLSHLNVTMHAKRRYTRPLVVHVKVRKAMHTSFNLCGAGRRVSVLTTNVRHIDEVF